MVGHRLRLGAKPNLLPGLVGDALELPVDCGAYRATDPTNGAFSTSDALING